MVSCLIDCHKLDLSARLYDGYNCLDKFGPERGTPLDSAIFNRNLPVAAELLKRCGYQVDLTWPIDFVLGGDMGIEYQEAALVLLMDVGGASAQKVLSEAIRLNQLQGAIFSLERGADAALALAEQVEQDRLALVQDEGPPKAVEDIVYYRKMSPDMKSLLEKWAAQSATSRL
jgi:hypothetical protein